MDNVAALQRLMTWLSPAFPVGAFAYSSGLETAIVSGTVHDAATMQNWLEGSLAHGMGKSDAVLLALSYEAYAEPSQWLELADLCVALTPARERVAELLTMGDAFIEAAAAWPLKTPPALPSPCPYPVAVGAYAAAHNIPAEPALAAFLTAYCHSQISVAIRLVPLGQTAGLNILAQLETQISACAAFALKSTYDDIGTIGYASDIAAMAHDTLHSRIFRS